MASEGHQHRARRTVSAATISWLRPFFRYSSSRSAYILRVVGARVGPVLVRERPPTSPPPAPPLDPGDGRWRAALAAKENPDDGEGGGDQSAE